MTKTSQNTAGYRLDPFIGAAKVDGRPVDLPRRLLQRCLISCGSFAKLSFACFKYCPDACFPREEGCLQREVAEAMAWRCATSTALLRALAGLNTLRIRRFCQPRLCFGFQTGLCAFIITRQPCEETHRASSST